MTDVIWVRYILSIILWSDTRCSKFVKLYHSMAKFMHLIIIYIFLVDSLIGKWKRLNGFIIRLMSYSSACCLYFVSVCSQMFAIISFLVLHSFIRYLLITMVFTSNLTDKKLLIYGLHLKCWSCECFPIFGVLSALCRLWQTGGYHVDIFLYWLNFLMVYYFDCHIDWSATFCSWHHISHWVW